MVIGWGDTNKNLAKFLVAQSRMFLCKKSYISWFGIYKRCEFDRSHHQRVEGATDKRNNHLI